MRFWWNPATARYETSNGRTVRDDKIRSALDLIIDAQVLVMRTHTQSLIDGTLSLAAWTTYMMLAVKQTHLVATAVAIGGWAEMDPIWNGWTGSQIKPQYQWLIKFSVEISSGAQRLDGTAVARAGMYASAARATNRDAQRRLVALRAAGLEKSNLGVADHCRLCIQEARKGWVPFGTLIAVGKRTCLSNCRCWLSFRAA